MCEVLLIFLAASEITATQPQRQPRSGILIVTLHEAVGVSLPDQYKKLLNNHQQNSLVQGTEFGMAGFVSSISSQQTGNIPSSYSGSIRSQVSGGRFKAIPANHGRVSRRYLPYALLDFDMSQVLVEPVSGTVENPLWAGDSNPYKFDVSRVTELVVHLYLRNSQALPGSGRSSDICLGVARTSRRLKESYRYVEDPKFNQKEKTLHRSSAEWLDVQYGTGKIRIGVQYVENKTGPPKTEDFDILRVLRSGNFPTLMVSKKDKQRIYAVKTIPKAYITSQSEVADTLAKRQSVLSQISHPFIVPLKFTFQSPKKLYFVSPLVSGGRLFYYLQKEKRFDVNRARLYSAELLCALECLHSFDFIYPDLKPGNILIDYSGHISLCDFGLRKSDIKDKDSTDSLYESLAYRAPEFGQGYTKTVDWWTLGVLLYEMLTGSPPFYDEKVDEIKRRIFSEPLHFPGPDTIPPSAKDILTKLLNRNPEQRLGVDGASAIKTHPFFHDINWRKLLQREYEPTFKPNDYRIITDTSSFPSDRMPQLISPPRPQLPSQPMLQWDTEEIRQQFSGWPYERATPS